MNKTILVFSILFLAYITLPVSASYDQGYGVSPHAQPPNAGWGNGYQSGSYYHYHVPLVGQNQYQAQHYGNDHHYLWPLLLLLAVPLLLMPLLPLLLLPLGISLLALLAPGGMMMMMMMMMMGGGMMMPMLRSPEHARALNEIGTFGGVIVRDITKLVNKYSRSLDLDECPERISCELGASFLPLNSTTTKAMKPVVNYFFENSIQHSKFSNLLKKCKSAFWTGSKDSQCLSFRCQPSFYLTSKQSSIKRIPSNSGKIKHSRPTFSKITQSQISQKFDDAREKKFNSWKKIEDNMKAKKAIPTDENMIKDSVKRKRSSFHNFVIQKGHYGRFTSKATVR